MKLVVISHKPCWSSSASASGYVTDGGFPFQMAAISEVFDETIILVPVPKTPAPDGTIPLWGHNLSILPLAFPWGIWWRRRLSLLFWLPRNLPKIWKAIRRADAVHTPIPGDIGSIGIFLALIQRKPLIIRHCGIWSKDGRFTHRFFIWLLEQIAGGRNVVFATGGAEHPPSEHNPAVQWIFSTSMSENDLESIPRKMPWKPGDPLRLITVARQVPSKNTDKIIHALSLLRLNQPNIFLDVVGTGPALPELKTLTAELKLEGQVIFHGQLSKNGVMEALSKAHIFCFPTESEGFPKAVHEALAWGLPVIAPPVSVLSQLLSQNNGILISDIEATTIAEAILRMISDEHKFFEMAQNAQETAKPYSLEKWRDTIGLVLEDTWGPLKHNA